MVKHTQTIRRQFVIDYFMILALKGLNRERDADFDFNVSNVRIGVTRSPKTWLFLILTYKLERSQTANSIRRQKVKNKC